MMKVNILEEFKDSLNRLSHPDRADKECQQCILKDSRIAFLEGKIEGILGSEAFKKLHEIK